MLSHGNRHSLIQVGQTNEFYASWSKMFGCFLLLLFLLALYGLSQKGFFFFQ